MEIKLAVEKDIVEIMFFFRECAKHNIKNGLFYWNNHHPAYQDTMNDINKQELFFLQDRFICAGVMCLNSEPGNKFAALAWNDKENPLIMKYFGVHPDWHKKDVGNKLLEFSNQKALDEDFTSIHADVFSSDEVHKRMLIDNGFEEIGEYLREPQMFSYKAFEKEF
ncbi:MAG: hypothetical protein GVY19_00780 [Bacteroidetes bacterium]|jgi:GNAT superfamily N-acetyltransferase|nr:hypothetical protein [Bacteroidota bacterium]